ncbi:MAG: hypothetical protein EOP49_51015, partial [Sphingobacteriales bacterium]
MFERFLFLALFATFACTSSLKAASISRVEELLKSSRSEQVKQREIASFCYAQFLSSADNDQTAATILDLAGKYELEGRQELGMFIEVLVHRRKMELNDADRLLKRGIAIATQHQQPIFLYHFHLNQAYVQTDLGNPLKAVYHYRYARKVAEELNLTDYLISTDIGISDIYMNIGFYPQAMEYLAQAQQVFDQQK